MTRNVLFLCTGNSARSIMAESYLNHAGGKLWRAFSAGSHPVGQPNPFALLTLKNAGIRAVDGHGNDPRSKSWNEFAKTDAPFMDFIVTVCNNAAGEVCPIWPTIDNKKPRSLHWSFPDPAAIEGQDNEIIDGFQRVFFDIRKRIDVFLAEECENGQ
ncbi:MAG: arsenate reductase ArsC [Pseudomonadota bacterium]